MHPARQAAAAASAALPPRSSTSAPARATASGSLATTPRGETARGSFDSRAAPAVRRDELSTNCRRVRLARLSLLRGTIVPSGCGQDTLNAPRLANLTPPNVFVAVDVD